MEPVEVSREIAAPLETVFAHFVSPTERERLDLHSEHVKTYKELSRGERHLAYEFVFQSYGFRFWGKAREEFEPCKKTRIFVQEGPMKDAVVDLLFESTPGGTMVRQLTQLPPKAEGPLGKLFGKQMISRIKALTAVHLDQHGRDIEGLPPKTYSTPGEVRAAAAMDFLRLVRAVSAPMILFPLLTGAALSAHDGSFSGGRLWLTLLGGLLALFAGNLTNDIWDFAGGADHATLGSEESRMTSSGSLLYGSLTLGQAWIVAALLLGGAAYCGFVLALERPLVPLFAILGVAAALLYQAPALRLSYKGKGLGELCIWLAFGPVPVMGSYYVQRGELSMNSFYLGSVAGLGAALVLYCHHFLHWRSDREAEKWSPIAVLGPKKGSRLGTLLAGLFALALAFSPSLYGAPLWSAAAAFCAFFVLREFRRLLPLGEDVSAEPAWKLVQAAGLSFSLGLLLVSVSLFAR